MQLCQQSEAPVALSQARERLILCGYQNRELWPTVSASTVNRDPVLQLIRQSIERASCQSVEEHYKYYIDYMFRLYGLLNLLSNAGMNAWQPLHPEWVVGLSEYESLAVNVACLCLRKYGREKQEVQGKREWNIDGSKKQ